MFEGKKVAVVLGGGGMKGLAHVGALKVFRRYGFEPDEYVGTSVGAYVAAMAAGGLTPDELETVALSIRKQDILDYDWLGLLWRRGRSRSLYRGKAMHDFIRRTLPADRFDDLRSPLYVTSVELNSGREVIWGMPGYREIPIHDCVTAACSLPGVFPPKKINQYYFVDGSLVDTLPVKVAVYTKADLILGVYLEPPEGSPSAVVKEGIGGILEQSQSILSRTLARHNLHYFEKAPLVLIRPHVGAHALFEFENTADIIRAGELAAEAALHSSPLTKGLVSGRGRPPLEATPPPFPAVPEAPGSRLQAPS